MILRVAAASKQASGASGTATSETAPRSTAGFPRRSKLQALLLALPAAVGLLAALPALLNGALYDDELLIFSNPYAQNFTHLYENLTRDFFYSSAGRDIGYYRPGSKLVFMLEYQLFGGNPFGYHVFSIALFLVTIVLAQRVSVRFGLSRWAATLGACLFASQPLAARTVATIAAQSDLLMATGMLACLDAYEAFRTRKQLRWLLLAALAEAAAISCKETALMTPLLVWLCTLGRDASATGGALRAPLRMQLGAARRSLLPASALLSPVLSYLGLRALFGVVPIPGEPLSPSAALGAACKLALGAVARSLAPLAYLPVLHTDRPSTALGAVLLWLSAAALLAAACLIAWLRVPWLRTALVLFWLPLAPILLGGSRVHISEDPGALVLSDRWLLLSGVAASWLIAALLERARARLERALLRNLVTLACATLVFTQALVSAEEHASYASENTRVLHLARLYREHAAHPRDAEEVLLAADALEANAKGDAEASLRAHQRLLALRPDDSMRHYNVAQALLTLDRAREALGEAHLALYGQSLDGRQQLERNDSLTRRKAEKALLLGLCYERLGERDAARRHYGEALAANPDLALARTRLDALAR